jgi:serine/threonine protein kinase
MSPEQHALVSVDHRADLYAAGLCLFELIAGRGPFDGGRPTTASMLHAHCRRAPPRASAVAPQAIPGAIDEVIARSLAKSPDERFASAAEMRDALLAATTRARPACRRATPTGFAPTLPSPRPLAAALRDALADLGDEPPTSSTWILSSDVSEAPPTRR